VVIFGSLLLIFAAIGLAVLGVVSESNALLIGSIGASLLAAVGLVVGARQSAAPPSGEDSPAAGQPAAERVTPVGVAVPAATGTVYGATGATAASTTGATVTSTTGASGAGSVGSTSPAPAGAAQALPGTPAAGAERAPTGTIPAQAGPSAFPSGAEPAADPPPVDGITDDVYGVAVDDGVPAEASPADDPQVSGADVAGDPSDDPPGEPAVEPATRAERERAAHLDAEVVVIDGHPRYHLGDCLHLKAREGVESLPVSEAEELGFSPCSACAPLRTLLSD
jgi:hypothetical protein